MGSAHSEAAFVAGLVDRGVIDVQDARELISISDQEQHALESLVETENDRRVVLEAIRFRRSVLRRFDLLCRSPDTTLPASEQARAAFNLACQ